MKKKKITVRPRRPDSARCIELKLNSLHCFSSFYLTLATGTHHKFLIYVIYCNIRRSLALMFSCPFFRDSVDLLEFFFAAVSKGPPYASKLQSIDSQDEKRISEEKGSRDA